VQCGDDTLQLEDVLERDGVVVLRALGRPRVLQADQHGDPRRHAPALREEPIIDPRTAEPSGIVQRLLTAPGSDSA